MQENMLLHVIFFFLCLKELNRQQALSETPDEDMVIRSSDSTSTMIVQLPSPKFEEEDEDYGRSGSPRSILATSTRTSIDSAGRSEEIHYVHSFI